MYVFMQVCVCIHDTRIMCVYVYTIPTYQVHESHHARTHAHTHTHTHTCTCTHTHVHTLTYTCTHKKVHKHIHTHIHTHTHTHTHTLAHTHARARTHTHTLMYMHMCAYILHIHTPGLCASSLPERCLSHYTYIYNVPYDSIFLTRTFYILPYPYIPYQVYVLHYYRRGAFRTFRGF